MPGHTDRHFEVENLLCPVTIIHSIQIFYY
jgi:hypothetical protein